MREISTFKERILQYAEKMGITKYEIYQNTGISNGVLSQKGGLSEDNIFKFLSYYTDVSTEWFITGNGPMIKKDDQSKTDYSNLDNIGLIKDLIDKIGELSVQLGEQTKENEHLYQKNMELQSKINELKEGMGDRWNKSPRRDPVYSHPDIAAEPGPEE